MSVSAPVAVAGRRQVTALFCDIVDSTVMLERLGPDVMSDLLRVYYETGMEALAAHGGHISDYLGDGILAYFGYPDADEDDVVNAIRAARRLQTAASCIAVPGGWQLQTRVGIATSLVVVDGTLSRIGSAKPTLTGAAPNLAARLMATAAPGTIAVEHVSRRIAQHAFRFTDLGATTLKGFASKILVSRVDEEQPATSRFEQRQPRIVSPLVGREAELDRLRAAWADACAGRGRAIVLEGEPGIGKSRLARELRDHADAARQRSTTYHCAPRRGGSELYPIIDQISRSLLLAPSDPPLLRRERVNAVLDRDGVTAPASRAVLEDLLGVGTPNRGDPHLSPESRRELIFETLLDLMAANGADPTLFLLEDLHWADSTTIQLIEMINQRITRQPWCLVITTRPDPVLSRPALAGVERITLGRLDEADAGRLCQTVDGGTGLPEPLMHDVVARCGGNPLFLEELTRSVRGGLEDATRSHSVRIPDTLHALLAARLDRLGPLRPIVSTAAVLGQHFGRDMLGAVLERPAAELQDGLDALTAAGIVSPLGSADAAYRFNHALFRDAAYDALLKRERERLHGRVVAVLRQGADINQSSEPERLALHLTESGAAVDAIPLWVEAARRAGSRAAHTEAASHLSAAIRALAALPAGTERDARRLSLLLALASSLAASRGYSAPEVGACIAEARALSATIADAKQGFLVQSACYSFAIVAGDLQAAETLATICADLADRSANPRQMTSAAAMLGFALFAKGRFHDARPHLRGAIASYRGQGPFHLPHNAVQDPLIVCLAVLPLLEHALGDDHAAGRDAADLIGHARALGRDYDLAYSLCWCALFEISRSNAQAALPLLDEALEVATRNDFRLWKASAGIQIAFARGGTPAEALRHMAELDRIGLNLMRSYYLWQIARLHAATGAHAEAAATLERATQFAEASGEHVLLAPLHRTRAELLDAGGQTAEAACARESAERVARRQRAWYRAHPAPEAARLTA